MEWILKQMESSTGALNDEAINKFHMLQKNIKIGNIIMLWNNNRTLPIGPFKISRNDDM